MLLIGGGMLSGSSRQSGPLEGGKFHAVMRQAFIKGGGATFFLEPL